MGAGDVRRDPLGRLIAHRGASLAAPENTLAALKAAAGAGAAWVEIDISLLGDGTAVLHHDATLDRCTNRTGPLASIGAAELGSIDAGAWFGARFAGEPLATLTAALDLMADLGLAANLELKPHDAPPEPLAETVASALAARQSDAPEVVVSSFDWTALAAFRRASDRAVALLAPTLPEGWTRTAGALEAAAVHMDWRHLAQDHLDAAASEGVTLRVYTANDPAALLPFRHLGLGGVITDDPARYLADPAWAAWVHADANPTGR
ncbi:MAG: glycerophosphodiester phosphodiesterase family protein [Pikeienuella sp.]